MRVAIVVWDFPAGTETFIVRHIRGLGADVVCVARAPEVTAGWSWIPEIRALQVGRRGPPPLPRRVLRRLATVARRGAVRPWPRGMDALWNTYVDERNPDVVLAEFGPNALRVLDGCRRRGIPLVVYFHGYDLSSLLRFPGYVAALPALFDYASRVLACGSPMHTSLEALGCEPDKIRILPTGAAVDEFTPGQEIDAQPCRFLAVSSMHPGKGTLETLSAFERCVQAESDVTLEMIGSGERLPAARRFVAARGLDAVVRLPGMRSVGEVRSAMARSGAFVQHSVTTRTGWYEGWGVSMAEAAASALPVIATRCGGIPDHVVDGQTGLLVDEGNWEAMGDAMIRLARDPEERVRLGRAGRKHIEVVGNADRQLEKLRRILQDAVRPRDGGQDEEASGA